MSAPENPPTTLNVRQAAFIGVGAMVGAGIFSLLGAAGEVAGAAVWISFLLAGAVAGLQGYSFARGRRLDDVAAEVVHGGLRIDVDPDDDQAPAS